MSFNTGEEFYLCTVCGKKFRRKSCLKMHSRIHGAKKSCFCVMCAETNKHNDGSSKMLHSIKKKRKTQLSDSKNITANGKSVFASKKAGLATEQQGLLANKCVTQDEHALVNIGCVSPSRKSTSSNARSLSLNNKSVLVTGKSVSSNRNPDSSSGKSIIVRGKITEKAVLSSRKAASERDRGTIRGKKNAIPNGTLVLETQTANNGDSNPLMANFRDNFKWFCTKSAYKSFQKISNQLVLNMSNITRNNDLNNKIIGCRDTMKNDIRKEPCNNHCKCRICGKSCGCDSILKDHMIVHLDKKLYSGLKCWKVKLERLEV
ncbi:zinc finger protein 62-like isoform X1 [Penaeus chinensis]|uniref:zinc finger protein 62-like isoform X1 n=2 Tax=Penaeus chinensis TaxID=139456 RepID=UPI001FB74AFC|nr:zinc finger protein 62-like isoform X1 [Penaeus chinensis]